MAADPRRPKTMLVLGGTRSGKSEYAESLVADAPRVTYVATSAPWTDGDPDTSDAGLATGGSTGEGGTDPEWSARLAAHRARRPATWHTEETGKTPEQLASLIEASGETDTLLVDDLGGWLAALLDSSRDMNGGAASHVTDTVAGLAAALAATSARVILVSPEVGMTVVPATRLGRTFTDAMGSTNRAVADACDVVALVVAGQPILLRGDAVPAMAAGGDVRTAEAAARAATAGTAAGLVEQAARRARPAAVPRVAAPVEVGDDELDELRVGMPLPLPDDDAAGAAAEHASRLPVAGAGLRDVSAVVSFVAGATGDPRPAPFASVRVIVVDGAYEGAIAAGDSAELWADRRADGANALHRLAAMVPEITVEYAAADPGAPLESGPAMTDEERDRALRRGFRLANAAADRGDDAIVLAAGGPGLDAAATALVAGITRMEVPSLLGRVHGPDGTIDDEAWMLRCVTIRDALRRVRDLVPDGPTMLSAVGGPALALATGVLLGAAARRTPVFLDGPVGAAAALAARDWAAQVRLWCALVDLGGDATARAATDRLGLTPLFAVGLGLGEGANALALFPVVQAALTVGTLGAA